MRKIIKSLDANVYDYKDRETIYKDMIAAFEDNDWDTQNECMGIDPAFDNALRELQQQRD